MSTDHSSLSDRSVPQWKKELILRRRAVGRILPAGSGSVQLTSPSEMAAVRRPSCCAGSCFNSKTCAIEHELHASQKGMKFVEHIKALDNFAEQNLKSEFKKCLKKLEKCPVNHILKMGEEKISKKGDSGEECSECLVKDDDNLSDSSEEFKYGPGIVSKLKSRYLSLTLRESPSKVRPSLTYMRRAASLENILDGPEIEKSGDSKSLYLKHHSNAVDGNILSRCRNSTQSKRDSMKRAASVETLIRCNRGKCFGQCNRTFEVFPCGQEHENEQRKLLGSTANSCLENKELPPPDVVKHTLKIFENSTAACKNISSSAKDSLQKRSVQEVTSVSAKKPVIFPKPLVSRKVKQNGNVQSKNHSESCTSQSSFETLGNKLSKNHEVENGDKALSEEKARETCHAKLDISEKASHAANAMDESCEPAETGSIADVPEAKCNAPSTDIPDREARPDPVPARERMILDLAEPPDNSSFLNYHNNINGNINSHNAKSSISQTGNKRKNSPPPEAATSPKTIADDGIHEGAESIFEIPEPIRSISPVLVRAPPCILSSEINVCHSGSSTQHMKQLGVVRPIVTNKTGHCGSPFPSQKYHLNKSHSVLTDREIEKNLINAVKSIEQPVTKVIVSLKKSHEECTVTNSSKLREHEENRKEMGWNKKPNTMIFNFSNRKSIPDYIENDGLILSSRREKPKRGEPGIIFLAGGTDDSSSDFNPEDVVSDLPSPCNFIFEGDNILINGKSNIQSKPKVRKMKIQFNEEATTMFEYPSEASLLDDCGGVNGRSSLASYTPSKIPLNTDFELGVSKTLKSSKSSRSENKKPQEEEEPETEEYLRPADESSATTWSSETEADLLF